MRITIGKMGISLDQTESILTFCEQYWGKPDKLKTVRTPFLTDSQFSKDLLESVPASPTDLKLLEKEYNGSYRSIYGSLLHFSNISRPDLMYAMCRLGKYMAAPTAAAFAGLRRICRYLATTPHRPIFYRSSPISETNVVVFDWSSNDTEKKTFKYKVEGE